MNVTNVVLERLLVQESFVTDVTFVTFGCFFLLFRFRLLGVSFVNVGLDFGAFKDSITLEALDIDVEGGDIGNNGHFAIILNLNLSRTWNTVVTGSADNVFGLDALRHDTQMGLLDVTL